MPGEEAWPTQPFPTAPPPFARQSFTVKDLSPFIDDSAEMAGFRDEMQGARNEGIFTPPGLRNTVEMPGNNGGANFSGAAIDPEHGTMFIVSKDFPAMLKLSLTGPDTGDPATMRYKSAFGFMVTSSGLSAIKPPWTTFTAYDLNTGTIKWQIPLGQVPELAAKGFTDTGAHFPKVGPVVTAGGLIFTGTRDRDIRALDVDTGKELWKAQVDSAVEGIPAVYEIGGREYIVYCAAARATTHTHAIPGHPAAADPVAGAYVAFALRQAK
jgi:quinoprotein glucose dehydrogenase